MFSIINNVDCNKRCPSGGHLDSNCSLCVCSSVALFGRVRDNIKAVVEDAEIYLDSRPYDPIGFTNYLGFFNVSNVCMMNEKILIVKGGYESVSITPTEVNSTHWTINGTLIKTGLFKKNLSFLHYYYESYSRGRS